MRSVLSALAACVWAMTAEAAVVWDQSDVNVDINALVDQEFGDYPDFSSYMVTDVMVSAGPWNIFRITTFFTFNSDWIGEHEARLNIFTKPPYPDCSFPADDATVGQVVPVTISNGVWGLEVVADGLNIKLPSGHYWIGLTPIMDHATYGQAWHQAAPILMCNTGWQNPGGGFGYGTDWTYAYGVDNTGAWQDTYDMAILIEGRIPSPGALPLLGLAGFARRRRR